MKKTAIHSAIGAMLAGSLLGGCTHFVVADGNKGADDDFFFEESSTAQSTPAPAPQPKPVESKVVQSQPKPLPVAAVEKEQEPAVVKTPAPKVAQNNPDTMECTPHDRQVYFKNANMKVEEIKVRASGYGAPPKAFYPEPQRRLMAMRAAKIDAYRSLAERVKGVQIWGGTTIGDMVVEKDRFRVFLDTFLVGAKVMLQTPHEDGTFETVVEMKVGQKFVKTMLNNAIMQPPVDANDPCAQEANPASMMRQTRRMDGSLMPTSARMGRSGFYFDRE